MDTTEYRALMIYDHLPEGCEAFLCEDTDSTPHIRPGEFVVIDAQDKRPRNGEVYVIQWESGRRAIVQVDKFNCNFRTPGSPFGWFVGALNRPRTREETEAEMRSGRVFRGCVDGPYREGTGHLESKLIGCVIGLYVPPAGFSERSDGS